MSSSSISMLLAWSCVYTTLLSLPPSTSPSCFLLSSLSYLYKFLPAHLVMVLPLFLVSPLFRVKQSQIWTSYYYRAAVYSYLYCFFQFPYLIIELCVFFVFAYCSASLSTSSLSGLPPLPHPSVTAGCAFGFSGPCRSSILG